MPSMTTDNWEKEFDEKFVHDDGLMDKYTWDDEDKGALGPIDTATMIKRYIRDLLARERERVVGLCEGMKHPMSPNAYTEALSDVLSALDKGSNKE